MIGGDSHDVLGTSGNLKETIKNGSFLVIETSSVREAVGSVTSPGLLITGGDVVIPHGKGGTATGDLYVTYIKSETYNKKRRIGYTRTKNRDTYEDDEKINNIWYIYIGLD